jgi:hypothetical protein
MDTNQETTNHETITPAAAVEIPLPVPAWTPEEAVEALRAMRLQIGEVTPLTAEQRTTLRNRARTTNPILQASINVIGALENVSQAVGQPAAAVRQLCDEANRWTALEDELRAMLNGVAGANLIRRQRIALIATQAFTIGAQLARDPAHAALVPHLAEIKRLKSFKRRKKAAQTPAPPSSPVPGTTSET